MNFLLFHRRLSGNVSLGKIVKFTFNKKVKFFACAKIACYQNRRRR